MNKPLKKNLKAHVVEELKKNTGTQGLDLSAFCADQVTEIVFGKIDDLVKKESTFDKQWKIVGEMNSKKKSRPKPKAKVKAETQTPATVV